MSNYMEVRLLRMRRALPATLIVAAAVAVTPATAQAGGGVSPGGGNGGNDGKTVDPASISGVPWYYAKFTSIVSGKTGLSARVVAGWTLAEGGPKDNPLNIGPGERYGTVGKGARTTVRKLRTDLYAGIMRSVSRSDMKQIDAIVASPWCYRCKGYKRLLKSTYGRVSVGG